MATSTMPATVPRMGASGEPPESAAPSAAFTGVAASVLAGSADAAHNRAMFEALNQCIQKPCQLYKGTDTPQVVLHQSKRTVSATHNMAAKCCYGLTAKHSGSQGFRYQHAAQPE